MTPPPMASRAAPRGQRIGRRHHRRAARGPALRLADQGLDGVHLGSYPIATSQCSPTTLSQVSYHIQSPLFESDDRIYPDAHSGELDEVLQVVFAQHLGFGRIAESTLLFCLSYNSPYNPPQNKRILDEEEERGNRSSQQVGFGRIVVSETAAPNVLANLV
jgi:hypothetical protein